MNIKKILIFTFSLIIVSNLFSQAYKINLKVEGVKDTVVYLGHHYANKKYSKDTVQINSEGEAVFSGDEKLDGGIYLILFPSRNMTYFELLIDEDQKFSLETDTIDYVGNMKVKGSKLNELFYKFQQDNIDIQTEIMETKKKLKDKNANKDSLNNVLKELFKQRQNKNDIIIEKHPDLFLTTILKAMKEPEIPKIEIPEDCTNPDSLKRVKRYLYVKEHYFDNIDFSDNRLLRTPIFHNKLNTFMRKMIMQHPDTIIKEGDALVKKSEANHDVYQYVLAYMLGYYEKTKIMGMDEVFVYFGENYYLAGKADWADSTLLSKIEERVIALKPNLMGQKAENLKLYTYEGRPYELYDVESKYTILIFYEPSCGHCKKVIPKLKKMYDKYSKYDWEVYAVFTQYDKKEWKAFIDKHELNWINVYDRYNFTDFRTKYDIYSTPVIYVLDENKEIIAKRIDISNVKELLKRVFDIVEEEEEEENNNDKKEDSNNKEK